MSSEGEEDDTWELLKENKVVVPEGLRRILNDLDFKGIRALAKVNEHAADIESYIRETLGDSSVVEQITSEEKIIFFGPILSRCPTKYKPGQKVTLQILSDVCTQIASRWQTVSKLSKLSKPQIQSLVSGKLLETTHSIYLFTHFNYFVLQ